MYQRNDIYYCSCCANFYEKGTHKKVHIAYHELSAEMALEVMIDRQKIANDKLQESMRRRARKSQLNKPKIGR